MIYAKITTKKRHEDLARYLEGPGGRPMSPFTVIGRDAAGVAVWVCQPCAKAMAQGKHP